MGDTTVNGHQWWLLAAVLVVGLALRTVALDTNPPGSWPDEESNGYDAFCLTHTGCDRHGAFLPLFFRSYDMVDQELFRYVCVATQAVLGTTRVGLRAAAVLVGMLTVVLTFMVGRRMAGSTWVGLAAAAVLAVSPWHLRYSRYAHGVITMPLAMLVVVWLYLRWLDRPRRWALPLGVAVAASFYTYAVAKAAVPLLVLTLLLAYRRRSMDAIRRAPRLTVAAVLVVLLLSVPIARFNLTLTGTDQLRSMSVFGQARQARGPDANALSVLGQGLATWGHNYAAHYSPPALLWRGAADPPMHVAGIGFLNYVDVPLLLVGIAWLVWRRGPVAWLLLGWLVWYPLGSALMGPADYRRALCGVPAVALVGGLGLVVMSRWLGRRRGGRLVLGVFCIAAAANLALVGHQLFVDYPQRTAVLWRHGYREAVRFIETSGRGCPRVWVDGDALFLPHGAVCFYGRIDPRVFQQHTIPVNRATMRDYGTVGRYHIVPRREILERLRTNPNDAFWLGVLPIDPRVPGRQWLGRLPNGRVTHRVWLPPDDAPQPGRHTQQPRSQ